MFTVFRAVKIIWEALLAFERKRNWNLPKKNVSSRVCSVLWKRAACFLLPLEVHLRVVSKSNLCAALFLSLKNLTRKYRMCSSWIIDFLEIQTSVSPGRVLLSCSHAWVKASLGIWAKQKFLCASLDFTALCASSSVSLTVLHFMCSSFLFCNVCYIF